MELRKPAERLMAGAILALLFLSPAVTPAAEPIPDHHRSVAVSKEYRLKAAFIFHFLRYTTWPDKAFDGDEDAPFLFGLIGKNPFEDHLKELLDEKEIHGRKIRYKTCKNAEEAATCHALFLSPDALKTHPELLSELREKPILLIGESKNFAADGGMLGFFIEEDKVRFEACRSHINEADLNVSSRLLNLARIVESNLPEEEKEKEDPPKKETPDGESPKGGER